MDIIIPLAIFSILGWAVIAILARLAPVADREWLANVMLAALAFRLICATLFGVFPGLRIFHEDANGYEYFGMQLASSWRGEGPPIPDLAGEAGFRLLSGALYFVFGRYQVVVSYFNCVLGTVIVFLVYRLTGSFFHHLVARRAALLVAFMPSMVLWSAMALKDVLVTSAIVVSLSSCVSLKQRVTVQAFLGTLLPLVIIYMTRFYMMYFVVFSVVLALVIDRGINMLTGVYKQLFVVLAAVGLFALLGLTDRTEVDTRYFSLEYASAYRRGMATTAQSGFAHDVDVSTPAAALAFLPVGMANMLFAPFPWQMVSLRPLIAAPETIFWWCLVPATIRGMFFAIRRRFSQTSPILIFAATLTPAYSLIHGNIGSAFRQRAQILVFLFVFCAVGMYQAKCRKAGVDPANLLRQADEGEGSGRDDAGQPATGAAGAAGNPSPA